MSFSPWQSPSPEPPPYSPYSSALYSSREASASEVETNQQVEAQPNPNEQRDFPELMCELDMFLTFTEETEYILTAVLWEHLANRSRRSGPVWQIIDRP